jgi:hypothetical protein
MNLYDEDHVDYIMRVMPQLQFLNGLPVEREDEDSSFIGDREMTRRLSRSNSASLTRRKVWRILMTTGRTRLNALRKNAVMNSLSRSINSSKVTSH